MSWEWNESVSMSTTAGGDSGARDMQEAEDCNEGSSRGKTGSSK